MPCKPGVAGLIPGFSTKPLSVEPSGVPVILVLVSTHGKATKSFVFFVFFVYSAINYQHVWTPVPGVLNSADPGEVSCIVIVTIFAMYNSAFHTAID